MATSKAIADAARESLAEALRNKEIPAGLLGNWADHEERLRRLSEDLLKRSSEALGEAAKNRDQRAARLAEAMELERLALQQLRDISREMNASIEDALAQNFVNRLLAAASGELSISDGLQAVLPLVIGMDFRELPPAAAEELAGLALREDEVRTRARHIHEDLAGFYSRTRIKLYDDVYREISEAETMKELGELAEQIRRNLSGRAVGGCREWAAHFRKWAERLNSQCDSGGAAGGSEPRNMAPEDIQALIALMRARLTEEEIREGTRLAHDRRSAPDYRAAAKELERVQGGLALEMGALGNTTRNAKLRSLILKIEALMHEAEHRLGGWQTDAETIAVETEIIERLGQSLSESSAEGSAGATLLQALGMGGAGPAGGGNPAHGPDAGTIVDVSGPAGTDGGAERTGERTAGVDEDALPAEFREILSAYFSAMEAQP